MHTELQSCAGIYSGAEPEVAGIGSGALWRSLGVFSQHALLALSLLKDVSHQVLLNAIWTKPHWTGEQGVTGSKGVQRGSAFFFFFQPDTSLAEHVASGSCPAVLELSPPPGLLGHKCPPHTHINQLPCLYYRSLKPLLVENQCAGVERNWPKGSWCCDSNSELGRA